MLKYATLDHMIYVHTYIRTCSIAVRGQQGHSLTSTQQAVVEVPTPIAGVKRRQAQSSVEALLQIAEAVCELCSDEHYAKIEVRIKAVEDKVAMLAEAYEAEMAVKDSEKAAEKTVGAGSGEET